MAPAFDLLNNENDNIGWEWPDDLSTADDGISVENMNTDNNNNDNKNTNSNTVETDKSDKHNSTTNSGDFSGSKRCSMIESLPPQLHPAVSLGMQRVQSCYFSVASSERGGSVADLLSLLGGGGGGGGAASAGVGAGNDDGCSDDDASVDSKGAQNRGNACLVSPSASWGDVYSIITSDNAASTDATLPSAVTDSTDEKTSSSCASTIDNYNNNNKTNCSNQTFTSCTFLYHDIMMHILTFLDAPSLASFSETARQPNFECFYFLQLQLQRALLHHDHSTYTHNHQRQHQQLQQNHSQHRQPQPEEEQQGLQQQQQQKQIYNRPNQDKLSNIAGSACISRLASLNEKEAKETVQEYLNSNSTLRMMPLSHSLAYMRQFLRSTVFFNNNKTHNYNNHSDDNSNNNNDNENNHHNNNHNLARAAVLVGVIGAASILTGTVEPAAEAASAAAEVVVSHVPDISELSQLLFRLGFVGSLMGAAHHRMAERVDDNNNQYQHLHHDQSRNNHHIMEAAEAMMVKMQELPLSTTMSSSLRRMFRAFSTIQNTKTSAENNSDDTNNSNDNSENTLILPLTPDPYEHIPTTLAVGTTSAHKNANSFSFSEPTIQDKRKRQNLKQQLDAVRKIPSGCVGAYFRAVHRASHKITEIIKDRRKKNYNDLLDSQEQISTDFIDACCSDDNLKAVRDLVEQVDVDGFYVGSDGTETCALHAAAFHGAYQVLEFLCCEVHEFDPQQDGGLCNVNIKDTNGWTALHFAAGANCVQSVRILQHHGALLSEEAANGYTPFQWAQRLQHKEAAAEIQKLITEDNNNNNNTDHAFFLRRRRPAVGETQTSQRFSAIQQFFSLIPTN